MKVYYAVVHKDNDSAFGISFPDLPGCFSAADREEDIVSNACEALDLWFEDVGQVEPASIESVRAMAAADLAEGAFLVAVPFIRSSGKLSRVNISMDRGMIDAIDHAAAMRKLTRSAFLMEAARNEIQGRHG